MKAVITHCRWFAAARCMAAPIWPRAGTIMSMAKATVACISAMQATNSRKPIPGCGIRAAPEEADTEKGAERPG